MGAQRELSGNKLIAKFEYGDLCENLDSDDDCLVRDDDTNYIDFYVSDARYHDSWDWLMPVIKKIRSIHNEEFTFAEYDDATAIIKYINPYDYDIDFVFENVVKFIKWYNER